MLIDKGAVPGEVITLKLNNGEELVAKLISEDNNYYKLSRPLVLSMGPQGIGMIPFLFTINPDKEIKIAKTGVLVIEVSDKQFADQYIQGTTGIKLA